jgi:hypothetical protein
MENIKRLTHEDWQQIAAAFSKAEPSSPQWPHLVDAAITYLLQDRVAATAPGPDDRRING